MKTKVIFRKCCNGEIIALFPQLAGSFNPSECMSYMFCGQHGIASVFIVQDTKLATPDEYATLQDELERVIGYDLHIVNKFTYADQKQRAKEYNAITV